MCKTFNINNGAMFYAFSLVDKKDYIIRNQ